MFRLPFMPLGALPVAPVQCQIVIAFQKTKQRHHKPGDRVEIHRKPIA